MQRWNAVRSQFMVPEGITFLNNGSYGPNPRPVFEALCRYLRELAENPSNYGTMAEHVHQVVKPKLASFVGARPELTAIVTNLTLGMNVIARGIRGLAAGDEVLATDQEYGAVDHTWDFAAQKLGLIVRRVAIPTPPGSAEEIVKCIEAGITPRTRLIYCSHVTATTGLVLPVKRIARIARERGILCAIDGAHAPGMLAIDVGDIDADFYAGNCHKWLGAPMGTAFLAVAERSWDRLDPLIVGWGWRRDQAETFTGNFESPGIHNVALFNAIGEAVDFQLAIGREQIESRGRELASYARDRLARLPGVKPITPADSALCGSMATYLFPPLEDEQRFGAVLQRRKIIVPAGAGKAGGRGRISTHIYNNREDVDRFVEAVAEIYRLS